MKIKFKDVLSEIVILLPIIIYVSFAELLGISILITVLGSLRLYLTYKHSIESLGKRVSFINICIIVTIVLSKLVTNNNTFEGYDMTVFIMCIWYTGILTCIYSLEGAVICTLHYLPLTKEKLINKSDMLKFILDNTNKLNTTLLCTFIQSTGILLICKLYIRLNNLETITVYSNVSCLLSYTIYFQMLAYGLYLINSCIVSIHIKSVSKTQI